MNTISDFSMNAANASRYNLSVLAKVQFGAIYQLPDYKMLKSQIAFQLIENEKKLLENANSSWEKEYREKRIKEIESGDFKIGYSNTDLLAKYFKNNLYRRTDLAYITCHPGGCSYQDNKTIPINNYMNYLIENNLCQP